MAENTTKHHSPVRPDTLLASVTVLLIVNLVQRSIGFGRGLLFGRWLDPDSLGQWDMAYCFLLLAAPVAVLGLPGSFGRYLERFRRRGQLGTFLKRTTLGTVSCAAIAFLVLVIGRREFAYRVFGDASQQYLMLLVACVLVAVILHHFLEAVFAGLRVFRIVSAMQFAQSMLFAAISLVLLVTWRCDAWSIVTGYGVACLLSAIGVLLWSRRRNWSTEPATAAESHRAFWPPLMQFAVWVWVTNLLSNLFSVIDRYMLVHYSGLSADESLALVGNYHASLMVPMILVSVANLLVGAMTPHLSHDWEVGDRRSVSHRLNLTLKLGFLGMFATGIGVLSFTPTLFHVAFEGKYDAGLFVLPWTLISCVWFSMLLISQTYVWCAEKTRHATLPLAIGLGGNIILNLLLLPRLGLQGAVMATALSTLLALLTQLLVNHRLGMQLDRGTLMLVAIPFALSQGLSTAIPWGGLITLAVVATPWVFTSRERSEIFNLVRERAGRWIPGIKPNLAGEGYSIDGR
ncbi:lipopolysaccharide biosynthesis protein [Aeoliella sp. ICT_H6.2]|uniref:Lipopolysaccharide biosynthesis protein n=1 Tax=Aeoliella straminimaris TaxID=2954799 RepID=A0A9X2FFK5_9BACT|nr:lipopolysaccharide biosynthesis protein [Aeoliella straminimaris]MCO6047288.1 lipopolysaccharide biosynthesis protein [Aeoliella straminimaris]